MWHLLSKSVLVYLAALSIVVAQDVHLSLYNQLPIIANPAMTGLFQGKMRASILYRTQWMKVAPYNTSLLAFELNAKEGVLGDKDNLAIGIIGYQDNAGIMQYGTMELRANAAYHKYLSNEPTSQSDIVNFSKRKQLTMLAVGFSIGVLRTGISKPEEIKAPDQWDGSQYNPSLAIGENLTTSTLIDFGTGVSFISRTNSGITFSLAASIYHILSPNISLLNAQDNLYRRIGLYGNIRTPLSDQLAVKGGSIYWMQGPYSIINIFLLGEYAINRDRDKLTIVEGGVVGDVTLGFGPYLGFEYKFIKIAFLYQVVLGNVKNIGQHTPEVMLQYINRQADSGAPRL